MKKILTFLSTNKNQFIIGIIFILLEPIWKWTWNSLFSFLIRTNELFSDFFYSSVAKATKSLPLADYLIISSVMIALTLFALRINNRKKELENIILGKDVKDDFDPKESLKTYKLMRAVVIPLTIFSGLFLYTFYFLDNAVEKQNANFQRKINIVSPYISEYDTKLLKSNWALMDSKADYVEITEKINKIIKEKKLKD